MEFNIIILISSALLGGVLGLILSEFSLVRFKLFLVFAGSYLFSITVLHFLPELFSKDSNHFQVSFFILIGFFMQQLLDYFSSGTEHGHIHVHGRCPFSFNHLSICGTFGTFSSCFSGGNITGTSFRISFAS